MTPATALPIVRIERHIGWSSLRLREIWEFRELFYFLAWRDVKVRYKQTVLGARWAVLQPLLSMLIFTVFFGRLAKMPSDQVPYPVFSYTALLPWIFFSNGLGLASNSLVGSANLLTKVYFPRLIVPASAVISGLVDLAVGLMLMPLLMWYFGIGLHAQSPTAAWCRRVATPPRWSSRASRSGLPSSRRCNTCRRDSAPC